ncbi:unnamed protein product [Closterium sp. Yama58-4]|nr:unnamed protein product [Closterium sp. Yama58-4]
MSDRECRQPHSAGLAQSQGEHCQRHCPQFTCSVLLFPEAACTMLLVASPPAHSDSPTRHIPNHSSIPPARPPSRPLPSPCAIHQTRQVQQLMEEANMLRVELTRAITSRHGATRGQGEGNGEGDGQADAAGQGEGGTGAGSGGGEAGGGGGEGMVVVAAGELEELRSQVRLARQEADMLRQQQHQLTKDLAGARSLALTASCSAPAASAGAAGGADGSGAAAGAPSLASFLDGAYMNGPDGRADVSGLLQQVEVATAREAQWQEQRQQHQLVEAELAAASAELAAYRTAAAAEAGGVESGEGGDGGEGGESAGGGSGEGMRKQGAVGAVAAVAARLEAEKDAMLAVREREVGELQQSLAAAQQREAALERDLSTMWVLVAELRHVGGGSRSSSVKESEGSGREGGGYTAGRGGLLDAEEMAELAGSIGGSGRWLGELRKGESMRSEGVGSEGGVSLSERAMELIRAGSAGGLGARGGRGRVGRWRCVCRWRWSERRVCLGRNSRGGR